MCNIVSIFHETIIALANFFPFNVLYRQNVGKILVLLSTYCIKFRKTSFSKTAKNIVNA